MRVVYLPLTHPNTNKQHVTAYRHPQLISLYTFIIITLNVVAAVVEFTIINPTCLIWAKFYTVNLTRYFDSVA